LSQKRFVVCGVHDFLFRVWHGTGHGRRSRAEPSNRERFVYSHGMPAVTGAPICQENADLAIRDAHDGNGRTFGIQEADFSRRI
jgi:hypothetical protein